MSELDEALARIALIRSQLVRTTEFRGYGPATIAATGLLAVVAACVQAVWVVDPAGDLAGYLWLWVGTAVVSLLLGGAEMVGRARRIHLTLAPELLAAVVEQFLSPLAVGALITLVLHRFAPATGWMMPGLWQACFALGLFAACRFLPRGVFAIGVWYLASALVCLAIGQGEWRLSPWLMAVPFGFGQTALAAVLQWRLWDEP